MYFYQDTTACMHTQLPNQHHVCTHSCVHSFTHSVLPCLPVGSGTYTLQHIHSCEVLFWHVCMLWLSLTSCCTGVATLSSPSSSGVTSSPASVISHATSNASVVPAVISTALLSNYATVTAFTAAEHARASLMLCAMLHGDTLADDVVMCLRPCAQSVLQHASLHMCIPASTCGYQCPAFAR